MDIRRIASSSKKGQHPGLDATSHRLEASKVVLNSLKRAETEEDIAFLKGVSEHASSLLSIVQAIEEGEVDDEFAGIALDACGLAFIAIHECDRCLNNGQDIPDRLKWGAGELNEQLEEMKAFIQKKISRGFLKRRLNHAADDEKAMKYREKLQGWIAKLGITSSFTIHGMVEAIIDEKVLKHDRDIQATRKSKDLARTNDLQPLRKDANAIHPINLSTSSSQNDAHPVKHTRMGTFSNKDKALPTITISSQEELATPTAAQLRSEDEETRLRKRLEDERAIKLAEKEKWKLSEQEFSRLPLSPAPLASPRPVGPIPKPIISRSITSTVPLSPSPKLPNTPQSSAAPITPSASSTPPIPMNRQEVSRGPPAQYVEIAQQELAAQLQPEMVRERLQEVPPQSNSRPLPSTSTPTSTILIQQEPLQQPSHVPASLPDEIKDREIAARLQAEMAKEIADEDERKAMEIAASLQRQWEAEDDNRHPKADLARSHTQSQVVTPRRRLTRDEERKIYEIGGSIHRKSKTDRQVRERDREWVHPDAVMPSSSKLKPSTSGSHTRGWSEDLDAQPASSRSARLTSSNFLGTSSPYHVSPLNSRSGSPNSLAGGK